MTRDNQKLDAKTQEIIATANQVLAETYSRPERLFVDGHGAFLRDAEDREYLDMSSGIAVLALGHRSEVVSDAVKDAADGLMHLSNLYHSIPPVLLAQHLVESSFADRVFYCNSGAEAVEAAIKFARLSGGDKRRRVLFFEGAFHGRTMGALAATDRPDYKKPFAPLAGGFRKAPWNDDGALNLIDKETALVLLEPIQGEQGVRAANPAWVKRIRKRCDQMGALLCFDEIQCGLGRTGKLWAHDRFEVEPHMMTLAKPLAGGLPIGAVLMTEEIASHLYPGCHGTTFGGGPLVTHVADRVFQTVSNPDFLKSVRDKGQLFRSKLIDLAASSDLIEEIRGEGLMIGLRLSGITPKQFVSAALEEQMLVVPAADQVIRLLPPLNITDRAIDQCISRLAKVLAQLKEVKS